MDNNNLFDTIKQKEQDFIKTLKDIAEAAFIKDSLDTSGNDHDMDDNQVDSDLSKVASEIAKSTNNLDDYNSDCDFEAIKVDKNCHNGNSEVEHHKEDLNVENLQTVIKVDVMEAINQTSESSNNHNNINGNTESHNNGNHHTEEDQEFEESDTAAEDNHEASSWKIDYIRVETDEKKKKAQKRGRNVEVWKTSKSKKEKKNKINTSVTRPAKIRDCEAYETMATIHDKRKQKERKSKRNLQTLKNTKNLKAAKVENWEEVIDIPREHSQWLKYVSLKELEAYNPRVNRCNISLPSSDVESFPCPACEDRFLLPTTFFQHIYRKSVNINFDCKPCKKIMVFHNKCSLKIHILGHLENDNIEKIKTDMIDVMSLNSNQVKLNSDMQNFVNELRKSAGDEKDICLECLNSMEKGTLVQHFTSPEGDSSYECSHCQMSMPTKCSLSAHKKIHQRISPYVCPECGELFYTFDYFKKHVTQSCYHNRKTMMNVCPYCPKLDKFTADREQVTRQCLYFLSQPKSPITCRYFFTLLTNIAFLTGNVVVVPQLILIKKICQITVLRSIPRMKLQTLNKFTS